MYREAYIVSDIRAIAAGSLVYPLSLSGSCQDMELDSEHHIQRPSSTLCSDQSLSTADADLLGDRKLGQTAGSTSASSLVIEYRPIIIQQKNTVASKLLFIQHCTSR